MDDQQPSRRRSRRNGHAAASRAEPAGDEHRDEHRRRSPHRSGKSRRTSRRRRLTQASAPATVDERFQLWLLVTGCYWMLLVLVMHLPGSAFPPGMLPDPASERWLHGLVFAGFGFLLSRTAEVGYVGSRPRGNPPVTIYALVFVGCVVYGYLDEATQPLTGRTNDAADWEADILGALAGVCAALVYQIFFIAEPKRDLFAEQEARRRRRRSRRRRHHRGGEQRQRPESPPAAPRPEPSGEGAPPKPDEPR